MTWANAPGSASLPSEDLAELHAYLTGGAPTGPVALTSATGTANAPGSASVTSEDLAELHAFMSGGAHAGDSAPTSATPAGAGVAAERGAASQEAANTLGDKAMVANSIEGPNQGDFSKASAEPDMIDLVMKETGTEQVG